MKKQLLIVGVVSALLLCGCQKGTTEDATQIVDKIADNKTVAYQEQAMEFAPTDIYGENRMIHYSNVRMDPTGTLYMLVQEFDTEEDFCITKCEMVDGEWKQVEAPWIPELKKWFKEKKTKLERLTLFDYQYGGDGSFYLHVNENSMAQKDYYKDSEKYQNDFYLTEQYVLKVDEKTNQIAGLMLPELSVQALYENLGIENMKEARENEQMSCRVHVMANGDYYLWCGDVETTGLYEAGSGEKLTTGIDIANLGVTYTDLVFGDDFCAVGVGNEETKQIEVNVYDEKGDLLYEVPTGVAFDEKNLDQRGFNIMQLGVSDNTILLATQDGIYEADYGKKEFTPVVDAKQDQCYYLSPEYQFYSGATILKGNDDDYYLQMYKAKMSDIDKPYLCHYVKK